MRLHSYELDVGLDDLVRDARRATAEWDWADGAFGHALSLPEYRELHPFGR